MTENTLEVVENKKKFEILQPKILIIGAVAGALLGLASAYLLVNNAEKTGKKVELSFSEGARIGILAIGLIRSISTIHHE